MNTQIKNRDIWVDILKLICSFFVVWAHFSSSIENDIFKQFIRIAVPIFFIANGYYYKNENRYKSLKKIIILTVISSLINTLYMLITNKINIISCIDGFSILEFVLFNIPLFTKGHLWYLYALIYILLLAKPLDKLSRKKYVYVIIALLLMINIILCPYSLTLFKQIINHKYTRNFLFTGIPFFLIGRIISNKKEEIVNWHLSKFIVLTISSIIIYFIEMELLFSNDLVGNNDIFVSIVFLAITLFMFVIKLDSMNISNSLYKTLSNLSKNTTTYNYSFHLIIGQIVNSLIENSYLFDYYLMLRPVIVFCITTFISLLISVIKKRLNTNALNK